MYLNIFLNNLALKETKWKKRRKFSQVNANIYIQHSIWHQ